MTGGRILILSVLWTAWVVFGYAFFFQDRVRKLVHAETEMFWGKLVLLTGAWGVWIASLGYLLRAVGVLAPR